MAREEVSIRQEAIPDEWGYFTALNLLGECLQGQGKLTKDEPQLLQGYTVVNACAEQIPAPYRQKRLQETHQRLAKLYETWGKPEGAPPHFYDKTPC